MGHFIGDLWLDMVMYYQILHFHELGYTEGGFILLFVCLLYVQIIDLQVGNF